MEDERVKNDFANTTRLIRSVYQVTAVVMAVKAWMKTAQPAETLDTASPPVEALDRRASHRCAVKLTSNSPPQSVDNRLVETANVLCLFLHFGR